MSRLAKFLKGRERSSTRRERIMVGILAGDAVVHARLAEWLVWLKDLQYTGGIEADFVPNFKHEEHPVDYARNLVVADFLAGDCERLFFIDADQVPGPETLACLLVEADIACGWTIILTRDKNNERLPTLLPNVFVNSDEGEGKKFIPDIRVDSSGPPHEIDAAGAAIMVIRRRVLEDPKMKLPTSYREFDGEECDLSGQKDAGYPMFQCLRRADGKLFRGEDIDFCWRAKTLGYSIKVHPRATADHHKPAPLLGLSAYAANLVKQHAAKLAAKS